MIEWLSNNPWAAWLTGAVALAIAEMLTLDFTLLMLATGALAGALAALFLPGLLWVQILVAVVVAVAMLFLLRPFLLRHTRTMPGYRSSLAKMVGSPGVAMSEITSSGGEVKVAGEVWTARSFDASTIEAGTEIEVYEIDGVTAVVYPRNKQLPG